MRFQVVDTQAAYRRLLAAPDPQARAAIFAAELEAPFLGMTQAMGAGSLAAWVLGPEQLASDRERRLGYIETLAAHDAWGRAAQSLGAGRAAFDDRLERIGLGQIVFGLFLSDMSALPFSRGYSGFGGLPGWVMTVYDEPTPENLARVEACTVHELHHNIRFSLFPFNPMHTTLGDYIVAEGLAEAFAAELYGEELVGPWVSEFDETRLEQARAAIGGALGQTGFNVVRAYIFGDRVAAASGLEPVGVPDFAGYALGYRVVRAYQRRSGASVAEATFLPAAELIAGSGFFS